MTERKLFYTDTLIEPGDLPGWDPMSLIGQATIDAARRGDGPWPDAGKVVVLDHESLFWMLHHHGPGSPWSSAQQAAAKLQAIVADARRAYPESLIGLYGLPFVPYGRSVADDPSLHDWIGLYHAMAVAGCDLLFPSVYPTVDPRAAAPGTDGPHARLLDLRHGKATVEAAKLIADGRPVLPFAKRGMPPDNGGRLMSPTEFRFQAAAAMDADGLVLWTTRRWAIDVACWNTLPDTNPNAAVQQHHRRSIDGEIGRQDWSKPDRDAIRKAIRANIARYAEAASNQLAGVRAAG